MGPLQGPGDQAINDLRFILMGGRLRVAEKQGWLGAIR